LADWLRLSANYAYLRATQPDSSEVGQVREVRRPKNSGSIALDGTLGKLTYGASIAYVGRHFDSRDTFPFDRVALGSYWLADARLAYEVRPGISLFARGTNLLDQKYQDVFDYRTEGRGLFAGVSFQGGRRSSP
jgi:vitamin B12 transporter